jgi:hypothetical protein
MQIRHETYDTKGNILKVEMISVPDPVQKEPSDVEVRLSALESKVGIQQADIEEARVTLMAEPAQALKAE